MAKRAIAAPGISLIMRRTSLYQMAFAFLTAHRDCNPDATWLDAANRFMERFGISNEDLEPETIVRECQKMTIDFIKYGI